MEEKTTQIVTTEDLIKKADEQLKQFIAGGKYKDILISMSNLNCYSITNQMLILSQLPNARCVNGMRVWNYNHRNIIKGEKAIKIIAPLREIKKEDILSKTGEVLESKETEIIGYKVAHVFDLSQTEGRELYEFSCDEQIAIANFEIIKNALERVPRGFNVVYKTLENNTKGYYDFKTQSIVICDGMPLETTLAELTYQIGNVLAQTRVRNDFKGLTTKEQAGIKQVETESIALIVCNKLGLDISKFNFDALVEFSHAQIEKFKSNLDVIRSVSYQMLSSVEPALQNALKNEKEKQSEVAEEEPEPQKETIVKTPKAKTKKVEVEQC